MSPLRIFILALVLAGLAGGQTKTAASARPKLDAQRQFVVDVVRSAVAMAHVDAQDRLRILTAAAQVIAPVDPHLERQFAREGEALEAELIAHGQVPVASMFSSGHVDCSSVVQFVDSVPAPMVPQAEQSFLGIVNSCPKQALEPVRRKLDAALDQGALAPRALLATMERSHLNSSWSRAEFVKFFAGLPSEPDKVHADESEYAGLLARMAPLVDKDAARDASLKFLEWLGQMKDGKERNLAVNIAIDAVREVFGEEHYREVLAANVVAKQVADTAAAAGEVELPPEDNVSVLVAMKDRGKDHTEALARLAPARRAREAAAHGFASGVGGDPKSAERYFDMAFSAADEVWSNRASVHDAPAIVQEISEAAAQVDPTNALARAQTFTEPSAQAISMLAVARVILGKGDSALPNSALVRK